jgi:hypothetical protein
MAQERVRVVVEVSGGVVQAVYAGDFVEVVLVDHDTEDGAGLFEVSPEGEMEKGLAAQVRAACGEGLEGVRYFDEREKAAAYGEEFFCALLVRGPGQYAVPGTAELLDRMIDSGWRLLCGWDGEPQE